MGSIERRRDKGFEAFLSERVAALWSGLRSYGRPCDGSLLQAWMIVLAARGITREEVSSGVEHFLLKGGEMPTPGEFASWCLMFRERRSVEQRIRATYEREKALGEAHRNEVRALGLDPDSVLGRGGVG